MTEDRHDITLRRTEIVDLEYFFQFQLDKEAGYLAAFTPKDPTDKTVYLEKYTKLLNDPTVNMQTILWAKSLREVSQSLKWKAKRKLLIG